jgi:ribulose-phosphate 3-epimerase
VSESLHVSHRKKRDRVTSGTIDLSASMMCANPEELGAELARIETAGIDSFHFDIMDGHFVPNLAMAPATIAALRPLSKRPFVAHVMVDEPEPYVRPMAAAGADTFIAHIEACAFPRRLLREIAGARMRPGIAVNPATSLDALQSIVDVASCILVMSVEPGFAGSEWMPASPERVRAVRALCPPHTVIAVDGHIDLDTAPALRRAGADVFVCGTKSIFLGEHTVRNYRAQLKRLRKSLTAVRKGEVA